MTTGSNRIKHVVIVGGGSAGWLTAGVIAADHRAAADSGLQVTLIESPDVGPIGVGEGTWPTMRDTLRRIGVSESDFIRECDASFKQGSRFNGWRDGQRRRLLLPSLRAAARLHRDEPRRRLAAASRQRAVRRPGELPAAPVRAEQGAEAGGDARVCGGRELRLPPRRRQVRTCSCASTAPSALACDWCSITWSASNRIHNGDIAALQTRSQGALAGDLFVDCTGCNRCCWAGIITSPFVSQKHVLFNDSALALQVPYPDDNSPIASQTISTAQSSGWIWDIGLPTRRGIGHVYSSAHTSDDAGRGRAAPLRRASWRTAGQANAGTAAQAHVRAGLSPALLAPQLRRHRTVGWLHRAARSLGAGAGRAVRRHAQRPDAGDARGDGHRRAALQRFVHLSMGTRHRFPEAALRAEPSAPTSAFWRDNVAPGHRFPTGCATCSRCGVTSRPRVTTCTASKKCFRRRATSTCCTAWAFAPSRRSRRAARTTAIAPTHFSAKLRR